MRPIINWRCFFTIEGSLRSLLSNYQGLQYKSQQPTATSNPPPRKSTHISKSFTKSHQLNTKTTNNSPPATKPYANSLTAGVEEVIYKNEHLLLPYKKTELVVVSPCYSVLPASLAGKEDSAALLSFTHTHSEGKCFVNQFRKLDIENHFTVDEAAFNFLTRTLSLTRVTHYITPMLEYFTERSRFGNYSKMYVNLDAERLDLFCFNRSRLILVNSYSFQHPNDTIYYILNAWEKLGLHQMNDELHICGDAGLRSRMIPHLSQYIQRVLPLNPPTSWYVAPADNKPLPLELKTLSLCV